MSTQNEYKPKPSIWYAGYECFFECTFSTTDETQHWINYYRKLGYHACALHENGKHQLYVSKTK